MFSRTFGMSRMALKQSLQLRTDAVPRNHSLSWNSPSIIAHSLVFTPSPSSTHASMHHLLASSSGCFVFGTALAHHLTSSASSAGLLRVRTLWSMLAAFLRKFRPGGSVQEVNATGFGRECGVLLICCARSEYDGRVLADTEIVAFGE
jgi:hypothetical protein